MQGLRNNFLARRWRGEVPVRRLLWHDMLGIGTLVNLLASFAALGAAAAGAPMAWAAALHFAPLPYNVFLFMALWRMPGRAPMARAVAIVWLVLMTVV